MLETPIRRITLYNIYTNNTFRYIREFLVTSIYKKKKGKGERRIKTASLALSNKSIGQRGSTNQRTSSSLYRPHYGKHALVKRRVPLYNLQHYAHHRPNVMQILRGRSSFLPTPLSSCSSLAEQQPADVTRFPSRSNR